MNAFTRPLLGMFAAFVALAFTHTGAAAATLVSLSGNLTKDPFSPTLFGSPAAVLPFNFSFVFDETASTLVPAGSIFDTDNGFSFGTDVYRISKSAISDFVFNIGAVTFAPEDLLEQYLGTSGAFEVLLTAGVSPPRIQLYLNDSVSGELGIGERTCPTTQCFLAPIGYALSRQDGGYADMSDLVVSVRQASAVPEPAVWLSLVIGFALMGCGLRYHRQTLGILPV